MGCIRKIFQILILALALVGFMSIGGKDFIVQQYENYFGNSKESTMDRASKLGDFSALSDEFEIDKADKEKAEHAAVHNILANLLDGEQIEALFLEFDAHETPEAKFAYQCDTLECDLQCKLYDEANCVDLTDQADNKIMQDARVKKLLEAGASWSEMWLKFSQQAYPYDKNFRAVSNYAIKHKLQK